MRPDSTEGLFHFKLMQNLTPILVERCLNTQEAACVCLWKAKAELHNIFTES